MSMTTIKTIIKNEPTRLLVLIVGSKDGFVKVISFGKMKKLEPIQIDSK